MQRGPLPHLPTYADDLTTRMMCATTHVDASFASEVLHEYVEDGLQAVGLPFGVNLVALVRHAKQAEEAVEQRDRTLAWILGGSLLAGLPGLSLASAGELGGACVELLLVLGAALAGSWTVLYRSEISAREGAVAAESGGLAIEDQAPPLDPATEATLKELRRANHVVYHAGQKRRPFVGSGWRITEGVWDPIDISRPAPDSAGAPLTPVAFTAADLHQYLGAKLPGLTGLGSITARNRLHVLGAHVYQLGQDALPDPSRRPSVIIPKQLVKAGTGGTGGAMATHLCVRVIGDGGRWVVNLHLRARLLSTRLSWEVNAYILPPLGPRFRTRPRLLCTPAELRRRTLLDTAGWNRHALFGSAGRLMRRHSSRAARARELTRLRAEIGKSYASYDYGASNSLRERAADWSQMGNQERADCSFVFKVLVQSVLLATEDFLTDHNIDTSDLKTQQQQIINNQTFTFNGAITADAMQIGAHGNMNVNQYGAGLPAAPHGGGQAAQAGAAPGHP